MFIKIARTSVSFSWKRAPLGARETGWRRRRGRRRGEWRPAGESDPTARISRKNKLSTIPPVAGRSLGLIQRMKWDRVTLGLCNSGVHIFLRHMIEGIGGVGWCWDEKRNVTRVRGREWPCVRARSGVFFSPVSFFLDERRRGKGPNTILTRIGPVNPLIGWNPLFPASLLYFILLFCLITPRGTLSGLIIIARPQLHFPSLCDLPFQASSCNQV